METKAKRDLNPGPFLFTGWNRTQPAAPRAHGRHDLPGQAGRQAEQALPQPVHELRRQVDLRLRPQGHLQAGQGRDPGVLQEGQCPSV